MRASRIFAALLFFLCVLPLSSCGSGHSHKSKGSPRVQLTAVDHDGQPISNFSVQFSERSDTMTTEATYRTTSKSVTYVPDNLDSTLVAVMTKPSYFPSVVLLNLDASLGSGSKLAKVNVPLLTEGECLTVPQECKSRAPSEFFPGKIIVGFHKWLMADKVKMILDQYCIMNCEVHAFRFAMWINVIDRDVQTTINELEGNEIVAWAKQRGWSGDRPTHTTVVIQFGNSATINAAIELINSMEGIEWLETILPPVWAEVNVEPQTEGEWKCAFEQNPNVEYAEFVVPVVFHSTKHIVQ